MNRKEITQSGTDVLLNINKNQCNLADTLDCGQCFRFSANEDKTEFSGVVFGKLLKLTQTEDKIIFHNTLPEEFAKLWFDYFDFDTDYEVLKTLYSSDEPLKNAIEFAGGIRILRQDSFEALVSFIISQNNNIPRIKNSIAKLCKKFGSPIDTSEDTPYSFPTMSALSGIEKSDLSDLGLGYRDDYIVDCVQKIDSGLISLEGIRSMPIDEARVTLRSIKGIGPKVAECALLFGFYRIEAFPVDTWIKKVLAAYYPNGLPKEFQPTAGIAQQFLFHAMRNKKKNTVDTERTAIPMQSYGVNGLEGVII